jgi:hypothetical protein
MLGQPELTRAQSSERFAEFVTLLDLLLTQPRTSWQGTWFTAVQARTLPGPVQQPRPPFVVAANGPKGIALAVARGEGWATMGSASRGAEHTEWWRGVRHVAEQYQAACAAAARPVESMSRVLNLEALSPAIGSLAQFHDHAGRAAELGFTDVVIPWPRSEEPFAGSETLLEAIAAERA